MQLFKTREEKRLIEENEQRKLEEKLREEREKENREREKRKKDAADEFMKKLESQLENKVITLILSDYEGNDHKQLAMNFLLEKDYVCVQNDISCTRSGAHYALTFVKKEYVDFFRTR